MEAVVREIDQWPAPVPGQIVHLPLIGVLFQVKICLIKSLIFKLKNILAFLCTLKHVTASDIYPKSKLQSYYSIDCCHGTCTKCAHNAKTDVDVSL